MIIVKTGKDKYHNTEIREIYIFLDSVLAFELVQEQQRVNLIYLANVERRSQAQMEKMLVTHLDRLMRTANCPTG